jgi:hypothetical protein
MYSRYLGQELARDRMSNRLAEAEAGRLAAAARQARPPRQRPNIPAVLRPLTRRPAT